MILFCVKFSKVKRRLEKKPPKRSTISTTPRFLMKKKGKAVTKRQKGGRTSQTAVGQQKVKINKTKKERRREKDNVLQKKGSNSPGDKFKK